MQGCTTYQFELGETAALFVHGMEEFVRDMIELFQPVSDAIRGNATAFHQEQARLRESQPVILRSVARRDALGSASIDSTHLRKLSATHQLVLDCIGPDPKMAKEIAIELGYGLEGAAAVYKSVQRIRALGYSIENEHGAGYYRTP